MPNKYGFSFILTRKLKYYKIGQVITFKGNDRKHYAHRLVSVDFDKFTTKGDNHKESNPYEIDVPIKNIQGFVYWSRPKFEIGDNEN